MPLMIIIYLFTRGKVLCRARDTEIHISKPFRADLAQPCPLGLPGVQPTQPTGPCVFGNGNFHPRAGIPTFPPKGQNFSISTQRQEFQHFHPRARIPTFAPRGQNSNISLHDGAAHPTLPHPPRAPLGSVRVGLGWRERKGKARAVLEPELRNNRIPWGYPGFPAAL